MTSILVYVHRFPWYLFYKSAVSSVCFPLSRDNTWIFESHPLKKNLFAKLIVINFVNHYQWTYATLFKSSHDKISVTVYFPWVRARVLFCGILCIVKCLYGPKCPPWSWESMYNIFCPSDENSGGVNKIIQPFLFSSRKIWKRKYTIR